VEIAADGLKDGKLQLTQEPANIPGTMHGKRLQTRRPDLQAVKEIGKQQIVRTLVQQK
jgi:hypothetical protein